MADHDEGFQVQAEHDDHNQFAQQLLAYAARMHDLDLFLPGYDEETDTEVDPDPEDIGRGRLLAGAIWVGCDLLVDDLFADLSEFDRDTSQLSPDATPSALHELPPSFAGHYDMPFLQRFLTVAVDLGHQFVGGFVGVSCVAQELALRLVFNRVEMLQDQNDLQLEEDWRSLAEELLFWDTDHELLYDLRVDGFEESTHPHAGMSDMRFERWFDPFNDDVVVNPYAAPDASWVPPTKPQSPTAEN